MLWAIISGNIVFDCNLPRDPFKFNFFDILDNSIAFDTVLT